MKKIIVPGSGQNALSSTAIKIAQSSSGFISHSGTSTLINGDKETTNTRSVFMTKGSILFYNISLFIRIS